TFKPGISFIPWIMLGLAALMVLVLLSSRWWPPGLCVGEIPYVPRVLSNFKPPSNSRVFAYSILGRIHAFLGFGQYSHVVTLPEYVTQEDIEEGQLLYSLNNKHQVEFYWKAGGQVIALQRMPYTGRVI
ncbi:MAG TPA: hypothetical protein VEA59_06435, partial [Patescibacteria group bacterium]|nr:hypothetical protein [Patescibacteria group bacterium]